MSAAGEHRILPSQAGCTACNDRKSVRVVAPPESRRESAVFSFAGVLGITLVLFLVVALTGRLILGR